jgi:hypothetical protein
MTELAVVAPVHALNPITALKYQWALTSKLDNARYKAHFLRQSDMNKHVTLMQDSYTRPFVLAQYAEDIGAREIVLPFAKDQYGETIEKVEETLLGMAVSRDSADILRGLRPHIMLVPQGEDVFHWANCLRLCIARYLKAAKEYPKLFPFAPVIGILAGFLSRLPQTALDYIRNVLTAIQLRFKVELHLLDWNTLTTYGISFRSVSTMVPYIRAANLIFITPQFLDRRFTLVEEDKVFFYIKQLRKKL